jgi:hypothetical protein
LVFERKLPSRDDATPERQRPLTIPYAMGGSGRPRFIDETANICSWISFFHFFLIIALDIREGGADNKTRLGLSFKVKNR